VASWQERKAVGDVHEQRVAAALQGCGWEVVAWGQATLPMPMRKAISNSQSPWRYFPDLIAVRGADLITIDAKDNMAGPNSPRYAIKKDCVQFGLEFFAVFKIPLFYVFGNLGVLTPAEILAYLPNRSRPNGAYFLIHAERTHPFDQAFGAPTPTAVAS
jgi:Holliday junction resolvase